MILVVVLQENLSARASNNGEVSELFVYHSLARFIQRWLIVCRQFYRLRKVALFNLVPALEVLFLREEPIHILLRMLFIVELSAGPVVCRQSEASCHELDIVTMIPSKLLPKQDK